MQLRCLDICATLCAIWTNLVTILSKFTFIFAINMSEIRFVPISRQINSTLILGHLCHFVCHLDPFSDNIFKIYVHIRNQHV